MRTAQGQRSPNLKTRIHWAASAKEPLEHKGPGPVYVNRTYRSRRAHPRDWAAGCHATSGQGGDGGEGEGVGGWGTGEAEGRWDGGVGLDRPQLEMREGCHNRMGRVKDFRK